MIVDTHVHIWEMPPIAPIGPTAPGWKSKPDEPATAEMLIEDMAANGVDRSVLVQTSWSTWDNGYVADAARRFPERFVSMGLIDPLDPANAEKAKYWARERGMAGFRLHPVYYEEAVLTATRNRALWQAIADLRLVVQVHMRPQHAAQVAQIAAEFSTVPILVDHLAYPEIGKPGWLDAYRPVLDLARNPNVYVKVSDIKGRSQQPFPFKDVQVAIRAVYEAFGPQRLLWGTGYPAHHRTKHGWLSLADELRLVRSGFDFLSEKEKAMLLGGNADRIWPRPRTRSA